MAQTVKNLPTMWETWVQSLGWEDPLEEGLAMHSSVLAWRIPKDRGTWWATVYGVAKSQTQLRTKHSTRGKSKKRGLRWKQPTSPKFARAEMWFSHGPNGYHTR